MKQILSIFWHEVHLEWREKHALNGLLLYLVSTIMVVYLGFRFKASTLHPIVWNVIFWIILLFGAVNSISKSFGAERQRKTLYYYTLVSPETLILGKIFYNIGLLGVIYLFSLFFYSILLGNPTKDFFLFLVCLALGASNFSLTLTLIAGIASQAKQNTTIMSVLSFPLVIPALLMLIRLSQNAIDGLDWSVSYDEILMLLALNLISLVLSYILFPFLWRG
jgi:heme exporter protein B